MKFALHTDFFFKFKDPKVTVGISVYSMNILRKNKHKKKKKKKKKNGTFFFIYLHF